jgi:hypothetical protein
MRDFQRSYSVLKLTGEFRAGLAALVVLAFALTGDAQPSPDRELDIELERQACRAATATEVWVVYNYKDSGYKATKMGDCHWKLRMKSFMSTTPFSLRLAGAARTRCKHATQVTDLAFSLNFSLPATDERAKDMHISGSGFRYVRDVPVEEDGDVPCFEVGRLPRDLSEVQFDVEDVRVQVFEEKKVGCGLLIDDIWAMTQAKKRKLVNLTSREITQEVERQGVKGTQCYAPTIVPFAIIKKTLGGKSGLTIEVK